MRRSYAYAIAVVVDLLAAATLCCADDIELGRQIYELGLGRDGREISARIGGGVDGDGGMVACAGCHGARGLGGGESFVRAPDIRWSHLSNPYAMRRTAAANAPYDQLLFARAVRAGLSADGIGLDPVMPRFLLADDEIDALISYLSTLDSPSGAAQPIKIVALFPSPGVSKTADALAGRIRECAMAAPGTPLAAFDVLFFHDPDDALHQLEVQTRDKKTLAMLVPYIAGWENKYVEFTRKLAVDTLLPVTFLDPPARARWFFPLPGVESQIRALLAEARQRGVLAITLVYDEGDKFAARLAAYARGQIKALKLQETTANTAASKRAKLWLTAVDPATTSEDGDTLMLVPSLFYAPATTDPPHPARWRIAYAYDVHASANGMLSPVEWWATAACQVLARIAAGTLDVHAFAAAHLSLFNAQRVLAQPDQDSLTRAVYVTGP